LHQQIMNDQRAACNLTEQLLTESRGGLWLRVMSSSMAPLLEYGNSVLIQSIEKWSHLDISPGDIIVYKRDNKLIVHRYLEPVKDSRALVARGDNTHTAEIVSIEDVLGKVVAIQKGQTVIDLKSAVGQGLDWLARRSTACCHSIFMLRMRFAERFKLRDGGSICLRAVFGIPCKIIDGSHRFIQAGALAFCNSSNANIK